MFGKDKRPPAAALALLVLAGCAGQMEKPATAPPAMEMEMKEEMGHAGHADHSGHAGHAGHKPSVAIAPGQPSGTLKPDALDAPATTSVADAQRSVEIAEEMSGAGSAGGQEGHGGHGSHGGHGGTYVHVDAGREMAAPETSHDHHGHHGHGMPAEMAEEEATGAYVCPMHPEVTSATPGKCPKCGMDLVKEKKK